MKSKKMNLEGNGFFPKNRKAAMEMSVGTIVTIVLLMSVLVLGLFLIKNIFSSAKGAVDLTDQQLHAELQKMFSDDSTKSLIYPTTGEIEIKVGERDAIGIGIKNIADQFTEGDTFSYQVFYVDDECGLGEERSMDLISLGEQRENIEISKGDLKTYKVIFKIKEGLPNCKVQYNLKIRKGQEIHDTQDFYVTIES